MNESKRNIRKTNKSKIASNKHPTTLSEFYGHAWTVTFNKLGKPEQEELQANLKKNLRVVRGIAIEFENVKKFVRTVIDLGEEMYDKFMKDKEAKEKEKKSKPKS